MNGIQLVSSLLTNDEFADILNMMPDAFYKMSEEQRDQIWHEIYHRAAVYGETDTEQLIRAAGLTPQVGTYNVR